MKKTVTLLCCLLAALPALAQQSVKAPSPTREFGVVFGLSQPILGRGFNYELNYFTKRWVVDFSHGGALRMENTAIVGDMKEQRLVAYVPITIGFGVGYRFTEWLNLRIEPKLHRFRINYEGEINTRPTAITEYNTYTLGLGLYGKLMPFKNSVGGLKGIVVAPSLRWWPNVANSLSGGEVSYNNTRTGERAVHQAMNIGVGNSPFIINVSVGYLFGRH